MSQGVISGSGLRGRLRVLFPWKLSCRDKCGVLCLETPDLKLCTWMEIRLLLCIKVTPTALSLQAKVGHSILPHRTLNREIADNL